MLSAPDLYNVINEHVSKLSYNWFYEKKLNFKKDSRFKPEEEIIYDVEKNRVPEYDYDDDGEKYLKEYEEFEKVISIDIVEYCACYLPIDQTTNWGAFKASHDEPPSKNIDEYAYSLIIEVSKFIYPSIDLISLQKLLSRIIDLITEELAKLKLSRTQKDNKYNEVLDNYLKKFISKIYNKFNGELTVFDIVQEYKDKLKFNLNQEELASLLFVLDKSQIFNVQNPKYLNELFDFCYKYFYFSIGNSHKRPTKIRSLRDKYNEAASYSNPNSDNQGYKPMQMVIDLLIKTLNEIKRG